MDRHLTPQKLGIGSHRFQNFRSKYDELESALLTVKCLLPALASLWNACRQGPHSLGKHYPLFYARLESFLNGNRPRQQSLITLLGSQASSLTGTYQNSTTLVLFTVTDKRHWYPSNNSVQRHKLGSSVSLCFQSVHYTIASVIALFSHAYLQKLVSVA